MSPQPGTPHKLYELVLGDTLITTARLLTLIDTNDEPTLTAWDRIIEESASQGIDFSAAADACQIPITVKMMAINACIFVAHFFKNGARNLIYARDYLYLIDIDETRFEDRLVAGVYRALEPLAHIYLKDDFDIDELLHDAHFEFYSLADFLANTGHKWEAYASSNIACNLIGQLEDDRYLETASQCVRLARVAPDVDIDKLGGCEVRMALAKAMAAEQGKLSKLAAFDALERSLRWLPESAEVRDQALSLIRPWLEEDDAYTELRGFFALSMSRQDDRSLLAEIANLSHFSRMIVNLDEAAWFKSIEYVGSLFIGVENKRLALEPLPFSHAAQADWSTWSFRHEAYRRSIPDGTSLLREGNLHELLLELNHELIHILSMQSDIGRAIVAIRAVLLYRELVLWTFKYPEGNISEEVLFSQGVASLPEGDVLALAQAEQALELSRKMQILQNCWAPWFEGLAVFSEHAADPTQDTVYVPTTLVLANLVDIQGSSVEIVSEHFKKMEGIYSEALRRVDYHRLRTYLCSGDYHRFYLSGYLAVRSVVSAWRSTLGRQLSGSEATRVLLHLTRFGTADAIPELNIPLNKFREEVIDCQRKWLSWVATIPREDLEAVLQSYTNEQPLETFPSWRNDHLIWISPSESFQKGEDKVDQLITQALSSLQGANAEVGRVGEAPPICKNIMTGTANALEQYKKSSSLPMKLLNLLGFAWHILPIGRVDAPFWLNPETRTVLVLIRTTEQSNDTGAPGHNGLIFSLEEKEFHALQQRVLLHGHPRLSVWRFVDLVPEEAPPEYGGIKRGHGRNYIALVYEDWLYVQSRGLLIGSLTVPEQLLADIKKRVFPESIFTMEANLIAEGTAGAHRTQEWISNSPKWEVAGNALPLDPWAQYVAGLADEVLTPASRTEHAEASRMMLRFAIGERPEVDILLQSGLGALFGENLALLRKVLKTLHKSGQMPVQETGIPGEASWNLLFAETPNGLDVKTPSTFCSLK